MAQNLELSELADIVSVNSSANGIILAAGVGVSANGSFGTSGQALTTNGSAVYWAPAFTNGQNIAVGTIVVNNQIVANGIFGTSGQLLASDGSRVFWADPFSTNVRQSFTGNGTNTQFTIVGGYTPNNLDVYVNGVKQAGDDVAISSGNTIAFTVAPPNGSIIDVVGLAAFVAPTITGTANTSAQYTWTNTHTFNGLVSLTNVYANGVLGTAGQFLSTDGSKVYWSNGVSFVRQSYTADGNTQYVVTGGYTPSQIDVYINGVKQSGADLTISSGTNVVFTVAPPTGAVIDVVGIANATLTYSTINTSAQYTWTNTQTFGAISANGSLGTLGQVLTSNGSGVFWSASGNGGGFVNGQSITVNNFAITGNLTANGSNGALGQFLTTNGSSLYWSNGVSFVRQSYTADGNTQYTVTGGYTPNQVDVYINGVKQAGADITISSGTNVVFTVAPPTGAVIDVVGFSNAVLTYVTVNTSAQYTWTNTQSFTAISANGSLGTAGQVLTSNGSATYWSPGGAFNNGQSISVNNVVITGPLTSNGSNGSAGQVLTSNGSATYWSTVTPSGVQYTWTNTHTFSNTVFLNALSANGSLGTAGQVLTSNGSDTYWAAPTGTASFIRQTITANGTASEYAISGGYTPNNLDVYVNGVKQTGSEVAVSSGANIVFTAIPPADAIIDVVGVVAANVLYVATNASAQYTWSDTQTFNSTIIVKAISANGGIGSAGQFLTSNGTITYWASNANLTAVNSASYSVGTSFTANSTVVNAVSYRINTDFIANTTGLYHTGTVNAASFTIGSFSANTTGVYYSGLVNGSSISVGSGAFTANSTLANVGGPLNVVGVINTVAVFASNNINVASVFFAVNTGVTSTVNVTCNSGSFFIGNLQGNVVSTTANVTTANITSLYVTGNGVINVDSVSLGSAVIANSSGVTTTGFVNAATGNIRSNTGLTLGTSSTAANGYTYLPNGLIFQWGVVAANNSVGNATFPIAFPTACRSVTVTGLTSTTNTFWLAAAPNTTVAQIRTSVATAAVNVNYLAIGY